MKRFFCHLIIAFALLVAASVARAADTDAAFENANKLYDQGKYADAAAAYDTLIATGNVSEALFFNRGNAFLKMGQIGKAVASYRQAEFLSPRDPSVRANLQLARTRARGGSPYSSNPWTTWLSRLTMNEWSLLTAVSLWFLFILLAFGQRRPELGRRLRNYAITAGVATVASGTCLGIALNNDLLTRTAIVVVGEADVRNGPLDEAPGLYKVRDGIELNITDEKDGWLQVVDPAERAGWVRRDQVLVFQPSMPQKSKS